MQVVVDAISSGELVCMSHVCVIRSGEMSKWSLRAVRAGMPRSAHSVYSFSHPALLDRISLMNPIPLTPHTRTAMFIVATPISSFQCIVPATPQAQALSAPSTECTGQRRVEQAYPASTDLKRGDHGNKHTQLRLTKDSWYAADECTLLVAADVDVTARIVPTVTAAAAADCGSGETVYSKLFKVADCNLLTRLAGISCRLCELGSSSRYHYLSHFGQCLLDPQWIVTVLSSL